MTSKVIQITELAEFEKVKKENSHVVVDFTATWCGPCKHISPIFEELSTKYEDVLFVKVDVDAASEISKECGISCMPTFQFYVNGKKVGEFSGADRGQLEKLIKDHKPK